MPCGSRHEQCQPLTAGASVSIDIARLVCFGPQRRFVRGLTASVVKG